MVMRHKPIQPPKRKRPKGQRRGAGQHVVYLTPDQQEALTQFQKDFRTVYPKMLESQAVAQRIFQETIDAPTWRIAETQPQEGVSKPDPKAWSIGHAKVNIEDNRKGGN